MWYTVENGEAVRPSDIDTTSSRKYVYIRRNVRLIEATDDVTAHYIWEETAVPKDIWAVAEIAIGHESALEDVYAALAELAGIIAEVQ